MEVNKICVLGLGYIGLPTASMFAWSGIDVLGVDINDSLVQELCVGSIRINEDGLNEIFQDVTKSGKLNISNTPEKCDVFIIAVPTPIQNNKKADMGAVISATESIVPFLQKGNLVVLESTSPPNTTGVLVRSILERSGLVAGMDFYLAYSPERVLPGRILDELINNDRIVGGITPESAQVCSDLYSVFVKGKIFQTGAVMAEMVKLMENTYRDVNIALANEFSRIADHMGIDIWDAIEQANRHPRVNIHKPGPGVGGHCISVDPWFLVEAAPNKTSLINQARVTNDNQPSFILELINRACGNYLKGKAVAILGLTYKPDVSDLRESPSIVIENLLSSAGAEVHCFDPHVLKNKINDIALFPDLESTVKDADIIVILVNHTYFKELTPEKLATMTQSRLIIDTVKALDKKVWHANGFSFFSLSV